MVMLWNPQHLAQMARHKVKLFGYTEEGWQVLGLISVCLCRSFIKMVELNVNAIFTLRGSMEAQVAVSDRSIKRLLFGSVTYFICKSVQVGVFFFKSVCEKMTSVTLVMWITVFSNILEKNVHTHTHTPNVQTSYTITFSGNDQILSTQCENNLPESELYM